MLDPIAIAVPFFLLLIAIELIWAKRRGVVVYRFSDALTNLSCGITSQVIGVFLAAAQIAAFAFVYEHWRLFTIRPTWLVWLIAFLGVDFLYYWWHRMSHEVNVLWAAHVVHHQSEDYNLAVALRQSPLTSWTSFLFYLPLAFVGVPPLLFAASLAFSTLYQFWIHTQLVRRVRGPLDWILNLPSHHRVHHAINPQYLDKNYGAALIVWDRLFGTFADEEEECVYGITKPLGSFDPLWAQIHYWFDMAAMSRAARTPLEKMRVWVASPAWKPDGYVVEAPPIAGRTKYGPVVPHTVLYYVAANYVLVIAVTFTIMMWHGSLPTPFLVAAAASVIGALVAFGALLEGRSWAKAAEGTRLVLAVVAVVLWLKS